MPNTRYVGLFIETAHGCGRELLRGISRFIHETGRWSVRFEPHAKRAEPIHWLRTWQGDGLLVQVRNRGIAEIIHNLDIPVVDLCGEGRDIQFPRVRFDYRLASQRAFEHLHNRGFASFGLLSRARGEELRMDERAEAFTSICKAADYSCPELLVRLNGRQDPWPAAKKAMAKWLATLPKPVAVFACDDVLGATLLDVCRQFDVAVPEQASVLGVGNDDVVCGLAYPTLSSVDVDQRRLGYEAARLLDHLMEKKSTTAKDVVLRPGYVIERDSTRIYSCRVPMINTAMEYIRSNACRGISARDVARHVHLSRSALDMRMSNTLGKTVHQQIREFQLAKAKQLLANTTLPIKRVASETGFTSVAYMTRVFRAETGTTPAEYRRSGVA